MTKHAEEALRASLISSITFTEGLVPEIVRDHLRAALAALDGKFDKDATAHDE